MCEKCPELDRAIDRYKRIAMFINDHLTVAEAKKLLAEALDKKAQLHPLK